MEIILNCGIWYINGYFIEEDVDIGYYNVYEEDATDDTLPVYGNENFEKCLTWCYNN
jgi:hypothetical protein